MCITKGRIILLQALSAFTVKIYTLPLELLLTVILFHLHVFLVSRLMQS